MRAPMHMKSVGIEFNRSDIAHQFQRLGGGFIIAVKCRWPSACSPQLIRYLDEVLDVGDAFDAITSYLADHPNANDTLEGVTQWWMLVKGATWSRSEIQRAIARGMEQGLILETHGGDGQVRYSLMPGKLGEIRKLRWLRKET